MVLTKKKFIRLLSAVVTLLLLTFSLHGQSLPDFGKVDVKELSDSQLQLLLRRSKSLGIDSDDLV